MVIGIIGGGASGMAAALAAAEEPGARVVLLERQARLARKLQATGNGRCNLTNLHAAPGTGYHGEDPAFPGHAIGAFPPEETLRWFRKLGLFTVAEPSGRVYPYSDQACSVTDILRFALEDRGVDVRTGVEIRRVRRENGAFLTESADETFLCDRLIVACGGLAGTKLGGSMAGYQLLRSLGHRCTRLRPALVQLKVDWPAAASMRGVRANCRAGIWHDEICAAESTGEIQFTDYGLSGPVIFEISRDACREKGQWTCRLNFLPDVPAEELVRELCRRRGTSLTGADLFTGILHNRLGMVLARSAGIRSSEPLRGLTDDILREAAERAQDLRVPLTEPLGMDSAQVTAGGIVTEEFDPLTLESRLVPGLYACGEVLDVDGDCGGYNLQWAWSSGRLAGRSAAGIE